MAINIFTQYSTIVEPLLIEISALVAASLYTDIHDYGFKSLERARQILFATMEYKY